jgi:hypothetical protein
VDGPVQTIGPTGVLVTPGTHPYDFGALSELMKYRLNPVNGPEPTISALPNGVTSAVIFVPFAAAGAAWAAGTATIIAAAAVPTAAAASRVNLCILASPLGLVFPPASACRAFTPLAR